MDSTSVSVHEAEERLLTVKQQIEKLKAWNKLQENRITQKVQLSQVSGRNTAKQLREKNQQTEKQKRKLQFNLPKNDVDEQPLIPVHKNFQSLLESKLKEENSNAVTTGRNSTKPIEKWKFLRKGEGLSRFRMKTEDFQLKKGPKTVKTRDVLKATPSDKQISSPEDECLSEKNIPLEAFEMLEQKTNDSSFSSSSSVVAQLMEDSIKSTPIKVLEKNIDDFRPKHNSLNVYGDYDFFGIKTLGVIDEEPSKYEDSLHSRAPSLNNEACNLVIVNISDDENNEEDHGNDESDDTSDCTSRCSCCLEDNSRFTTPKSVSVLTEKTTTVFSPAKSECTREIQFFQAKSEELNGISTDNDNHLKALLQSRLRELEIEIDAFREENSHLSKLRENYEAEYTKFCDEKMQLLSKIRTEHLQNIKEIEEEKKKMQREKIAFEKYMKETKNKPNKQEKEEIRLLKEEIKLLKEEINKKESRWAAAQARIRSEMKQIKDLNSILKDELKELKTKKVTFAPPPKKPRPPLKAVKLLEIPPSPELSNNLTNTTNDLLQRLQFSDAKYIDKVRSLANNLESSPTDSRSVCVSSYLNNTQLESDSRVDISIDAEVGESRDENGNTEKSYPDGRKEIWYPNGNVKKISADGKVTKTIYFNGDVKEVLEDEIVKYYYAESKIWHSEYGNGLKVMEFPDGQIEKHFKNGSREITYPNGTLYEVNIQGDEKWTQTDGTVIVKNKSSNDKRVSFPNGQVEIHTAEYKRREYPDGTIKTMYLDGRQETRYWNGRIRLKTKDGFLLSDTEVT